MFTKVFSPRFRDTDALGHINNASFLSWFEDARRPIFKIFNPSLDTKLWNLIIARVEVDYLAQTNYQEEVTLETEFEKIGNSSMTIVQRAIQNGTTVAVGKSIMIHFDYSINRSKPIPIDVKKILEEHLV